MSNHEGAELMDTMHTPKERADLIRAGAEQVRKGWTRHKLITRHGESHPPRVCMIGSLFQAQAIAAGETVMATTPKPNALASEASVDIQKALHMNPANWNDSIAKNGEQVAEKMEKIANSLDPKETKAMDIGKEIRVIDVPDPMEVPDVKPVRAPAKPAERPARKPVPAPAPVEPDKVPEKVPSR
jgi:hypothetical protein